MHKFGLRKNIQSLFLGILTDWVKKFQPIHGFEQICYQTLGKSLLSAHSLSKLCTTTVGVRGGTYVQKVPQSAKNQPILSYLTRISSLGPELVPKVEIWKKGKTQFYINFDNN